MKNMGILKSELTWSISRDRLFRECRRAYYFHYYASWGGWERTAPELARKAYLLRNIQSIDAWVGDIVHEVIKWVLEHKKTARLITHEEAIVKTKQMFLTTWEQSRAQAWRANIKRNLNLFEHYYKRELTQEELKAKLSKAQRSIATFYECGFLESLEGLPESAYLAVDELDSFDFEGTKIFAVPDFALRNDVYVLYDWKTGRSSDNDALQLSCYSLYAQAKWQADPVSIRIVPVYLAEVDFAVNPLTAKPAEELKTYMRESICRMKDCLLNVASNKADEKKMVPTEEIWRCKNCKFQEICR